MRYRKSLFLSLLCLTAPLLGIKDLEVHLQEPTYSAGTLKTTQGGIIFAKGIRLQAKHIEYTNIRDKEEKIVKVLAEGDLLFEYDGQFFVGSKLEYDFTRRIGTLYDGRTQEGIWFIGGDTVELQEDGSYFIKNAIVTTSESQDTLWEIQVKSVTVSKEAELSASNLRLKFFHVPVLWFPAFKANLGSVGDSPIRYRLTWDNSLGPRPTIRYRFYSNEELSLYARVDYRFTIGPGVALESEYLASRTTFITRSYGAHDKVVPDEDGIKRYRLFGLFDHESLDKRTTVHASYDKYSDLKMVSDFPSTDFEISSQKRTIFELTHYEDITFGSVTVQPRFNWFESINQKLPLVKMGVRPFNLGRLGILSENSVSAGYLDYVYAHELIKAHPTLHEIHAARVETRNRLYRPFPMGPCTLTPTVGVIGIFYNNNQHGLSVGQGVLTYGGTLNSSFYRNYASYKHTVEPYLLYQGLSKPRATLSNHYTFNIDDGLYQINSLRVGLRNHLALFNSPIFSPDLSLDLYTYGFFYDTTFTKTFPKGYLSLLWSRPSYLVEGRTCWNFQESVLDFSNLLTEITISEHAAFAVEFRHRSRFDWRKADHESFLLDMARSISELLDSPLSDGRNTLLARLQVRLSPKWSCFFSSHYGWGRATEPAYSSFKVDALTLLSSKWQLKFSYLHTTNDDRFTMQMQLTK